MLTIQELMREIIDKRLRGHVWTAEMSCSTGAAAEGDTHLSILCDGKHKSAIAGLEMTAFQLAHIGNTILISGHEDIARTIGGAAGAAARASESCRQRLEMSEGGCQNWHREDDVAPLWFPILRTLLHAAIPHDSFTLGIEGVRSWIDVESAYSNRGKFRWNVQANIDMGVAHTDRFPRLFYSYSALLLELSAWLRARKFELTDIAVDGRPEQITKPS